MLVEVLNDAIFTSPHVNFMSGVSKMRSEVGAKNSRSEYEDQASNRPSLQERRVFEKM